MLFLSLRYKHFTDVAPWRTAVLTQSIAVSPPPTTMTFLLFAFNKPLSKSSTLSFNPTLLLAVK